MEVQLLQRRELPDLRRQARQLIVVEAQPPQRRELPDLRRQARQLIAAEVQLLSEVSCPISAGTLVSRLLPRFNFLSDVSCPISAGRLVSWLPPRNNFLSALRRPISAGTAPVRPNSPTRAAPPGRFPSSHLPNPPVAHPPATHPAVQGTSHAMSGALRRHPRRRMIGPVILRRLQKLATVPPVGRHARVLVQPSLNHVSHRPVRHHLRAAQGATRERVLGPVALKVRQNGAPLVRVPRIDHKHRVAEHGSRDGAQELFGLGVEICVESGVGQVAPCARGTPGSHAGVRVSGCRLRHADVLRRLEGAIERTSGVAASPALGTLRNFGEFFATTSKQRGKKITPRCSRRWRGGVVSLTAGSGAAMDAFSPGPFQPPRRTMSPRFRTPC